jgi:hypothetical protein
MRASACPPFCIIDHNSINPLSDDYHSGEEIALTPWPIQFGLGTGTAGINLSQTDYRPTAEVAIHVDLELGRDELDQFATHLEELASRIRLFE